MAIQHNALTDTDGIHEPKGHSTATVGSSYISNGGGTGSWFERVQKWATSCGTPVAVAANTTAEHTITVTGVAAADFAIRVSKPTHQAGLAIVGQRVSADNTVIIQYMNNTASPITPTASETYQFFIWNIS